MCVMLSGERLLIRHPSREHVLEMLSKRFVVSALFAHAKRLENVNYSLNGGFIAVTFLVHCQFLFCSAYYFPTRIFNDTGWKYASKTRWFLQFFTHKSNSVNNILHLVNNLINSALISRRQLGTYYFITVN